MTALIICSTLIHFHNYTANKFPVHGFHCLIQISFQYRYSLPWSNSILKHWNLQIARGSKFILMVIRIHSLILCARESWGDTHCYLHPTIFVKYLMICSLIIATTLQPSICYQVFSMSTISRSDLTGETDSGNLNLQLLKRAFLCFSKVCPPGVTVTNIREHSFRTSNELWNDWTAQWRHVLSGCPTIEEAS